MTEEAHIERHVGPPIKTLADVRRSHNVVGAFADLEAARDAILTLEQAGVAPEAISLLGAWPSQDDHKTPTLMYRKMAYIAVVGAAALGIIGYVAFDGSLIWAIAGAIVGGSVGGLAGWALGMGLSQAWEDTFAVDDAGTFAVGVHSADPEEILRGDSVLHNHGALTVNRFGRGPRRRNR
jgi:hypothetical protein